MVHLVVNVEHWQFDTSMPRTILTPPHGKETVPDVPNFSWVDYGMRAGLPRMIEAITRRGLTASTSFNAGVIHAYPRAAEAMHQAGVKFLDTPSTYFDVIDQRIPEHGEDVARLRKNSILIDADPETKQRKLLQIFTQNAFGPIFFEIIQRKGNEGFGEGNFQALFESIERDQMRRGVL